MSGDWRRIQGFRGVSRLRVTVTSDAEIELRANQSVHGPVHLSAGEIFDLHHFMFPDSFSLWLKSDDPNCQCQVQAEYTEDVTPVVRDINGLDMRLLYGPIGLGIPMSVTGNPFDYQISTPAPFSYATPTERERRGIIRVPERPKEQLKEEKPCPGITRLQAFKRELEEEKPKKKR